MALNYLTTAAIVRYIGSDKLAQLTTDSGAYDSTLVTEVAEASERFVDSFVAARVSVPVSTTTHPELAAMLADLSLDIFRFKIALKRGPVEPDWKDAYDRAVAWLKMYAKGEVEIGSEVEPDPADPTYDTVFITSETRNASRSNMANL